MRALLFVVLCAITLPGVSMSSARSPWDGAALSESELDGIRGGFQVGSGLWVDFGIERVVRVNGQIVSTTAFNLKGANLASEGLVQDIPSRLGVLQVGPNNVAVVDVAALAGTLIQNSVDHTRIENITTINATVNSSEALRERMLNATVRDGILGALRR